MLTLLVAGLLKLFQYFVEGYIGLPVKLDIYFVDSFIWFIILISGICTLGAVLGFTIYRYQEATNELVLSISFGWSFVIAVLKLPPVFAASTIFMLGHRTPLPDKTQEKETQNNDSAPLNIASA